MRVLCCALASHGFVYPLVGIALALERRGHEVAFVTSQEFGPLLDSLDLLRIPRADQDGASFELHRWGHPLSVAVQVKHIEYALQRFQADVLLANEITLGALLSAEIFGLPIALLGLSPFPWRLYLDSARSGRAVEADEAVVVDEEARSRHQYLFEERRQLWNKSREVVGLPPCNGGPSDTPLLGDRLLLRTVEELEGPRDRLPPPVRFVGSCLWRESATPDPELQNWLQEAGESNEPLIYVQQGRTFDIPHFWPPLVEALRDQPIRVLAALGRMERRATVEDLPDRFFTRPHIDQATAMKAARAVVTSGTTTPVLGAITAGRPMLLIPAGGEQPDLASRCHRAGAALTLSPRGLEPEMLARGVFEVLNSEALRDGVARLQKAFQGIDGFTRSAELIEELA